MVAGGRSRARGDERPPEPRIHTDLRRLAVENTAHQNQARAHRGSTTPTTWGTDLKGDFGSSLCNSVM